MPKRVNTDSGVSSYRTSDGKRWRVVLDIGSPEHRKQKSRQGFATKDEAMAWRSEQIVARASAGSPEPVSLQPLDAYLTAWLSGRSDIAAGTMRNYANYLVPIREQLGAIPLGRLTPVQIDAALNAMLATRSKVAVRYSHRVLKQALRRAVLLNLIPTNPADRVKPPREPRRDPVLWSLEDMQTFIRVNGDRPRWGLIWMVMAETWVRVSELAALRWSDVDLTRRTISINHSISRDANLKWVLGPTKTESSRRTIMISPVLAKRLKAYRGAYQDPDALLFPADYASSGFLSEQMIAKRLKEACARAGVPEITPHGLRHNGGSLAYMNGIDIKTISERMGHRSITTTLAIYTHLDTRHHLAAAESIGVLVGVMDRQEDLPTILPKTG